MDRLLVDNLKATVQEVVKVLEDTVLDDPEIIVKFRKQAARLRYVLDDIDDAIMEDEEKLKKE